VSDGRDHRRRPAGACRATRAPSRPIGTCAARVTARARTEPALTRGCRTDTVRPTLLFDPLSIDPSLPTLPSACPETAVTSNATAPRPHAQPARRLVALFAAVAALAALTVVSAPTAEASSGTAVMRPAQVSAPQMAAWFRSSSARVAGYRATVSVETLARYYAEEGRDEGVAGDLAFVQAVLETGSFSWPGHGQVRASQNNFAGIGACDGGTCTVATFRSARIGVRAQIQHLRAYADPTVTIARLAHPLESPRFHLVTPKGRAPLWEQMGGGNWATDPNYATKILNLYAQMRSHAGVSGSGTARIASSFVEPFRDVPLTHTHARAIEELVDRGITDGCRATAFCPGASVTRAQAATFLQRAAELPAGPSGAFSDVAGVHRAGVDAAAARGIAKGCGGGRFCPNDTVTRGQLASFLQRTLQLPDRPNRFRDVPASSTHAGAIGALAEREILLGRSADTFEPNAPVTRAQVASMLTRAFPRR
jgi:flagellum-specific peptidoglycan hydrolase FlgJ